VSNIAFNLKLIWFICNTDSNRKYRIHVWDVRILTPWTGTFLHVLTEDQSCGIIKKKNPRGAGMWKYW